jgi:hypothetical protein
MTTKFKLTLALVRSRHFLHEFQRRLVINGQETATVVYGDRIEKVCRFGANHLLVTSYDYFDGVHHWFTMLNSRGKILDMATTPDFLGFIQWLDSPSPDCLRFSFFGADDIWQIRVLSEGTWSFRRIDIERRWNRYVFAKRRMFFSIEKAM